MVNLEFNNSDEFYNTSHPLNSLETKSYPFTYYSGNCKGNYVLFICEK